MWTLLVGLFAEAALGAAVGSASDALALLQQSSEVQALLNREDTLRLTVKDETGRELHLEARKSTRLGKLMDVACKRLDLEKEYSRFELRGRLLSQYDTVDEFGIQSQDVIDVTGGRARPAVNRKEVARLQGGAAAADAAKAQGAAPAAENATAVAVAVSTTAAPVQQPVAVAAASPPPLPVFQVGDFSYVNISNLSDSGGDTANTWAPCSIVSKGSKNHTYNIHFIYAPVGLRDSPDVPAQLLRKVDGRRYAEAIQYYREDTAAVDQVVTFVNGRKEAELAKKAAAEAAEAAKAAAAAAAKAAAAANAAASASANATAAEGETAQPQNLFKVGDFMEIRLETNVSGPYGDIDWVPCRLLGNGERNHSYKVHFLFGPPGHADLTNISQDYLRKIGGREFAERSREIKRSAQHAQQAVVQLAEEAANRTKAEEDRLAREAAAREAAIRLKKEAAEAEKREREAARKAAQEQRNREATEKKAKRDRDLAKRAEEEKEAKRLAEFVYKDGAAVEVKVEKTFKGTQWLPGKVLRKGNETNSFDVLFDWGPTGKQEIAGVPTAFLHPTPDAERYADLVAKFKNDQDAAQSAMQQANKEAGRRQRALIAERKALALGQGAQPGAAKTTPAPAMVAGDLAEIKLAKDVKGLTSIPCLIVAPGPKKNTFNVRFRFEVPKHSQDIKGIPLELLRKVDEAGAKPSLDQLLADKEMAEGVMVQVEREAARRQRQEENARKKRQEAKAKR